MPSDDIRHYVVLRPPEKVRKAYIERDIGAILQYIADHVYPGSPPIADLPLRIAALPNNDVVRQALRGVEKVTEEDGEYVVALEIRDRKAVDRIREVIGKVPSFVASSADLPFAAADHWCTGEAADPVFADRAAAERLIGADYLKRQSGTSGRGVNVVIVDQGLNAKRLGGNYVGGWAVGTNVPGKAPATSVDGNRLTHGMMIAQNIISVAPNVAVFDLPLAPPRISDIPRFLSLAKAAFKTMLDGIAAFRRSGRRPGPWVLVNPWGIHDSRSEYPPGDYTDNAANPFNIMIADAVKDGIDVVFAAGNCGQFCPDRRCASSVIGPGRGILGANSLADVLTVGAVRADAMWLGYSAQGPGQPGFGPRAHDKPDLCASSQFRETGDAFSINTGTSAACALAGGVVAGLREKWGQVSPGQLKKVLIETARKAEGGAWDSRLGHGILDARAAFTRLSAS